MSNAPEIPLDIRLAMHECMLSIFWPKKQILDFLVSVGCPASVLPANTDALARHEIITEVFSKLGSRDDRGYSIFQTMIDRLSNWSHFDDYYFKKLAKLDEAEARQKIDALKKMVAARNSATSSQRKTAERSKHESAKLGDLAALKSAFEKVYGTQISPQARGKLFETFLKELFNRQSIKMGDPFRINGEEIDGTFKFEGENYITEAKWQDASVSTSQLYQFAHKTDGKMHGRGLFISVNGYSSEGIKAIVHGKMIKTMLMDGQDLTYVLEGLISLEDLLDEKIRAAQTRGEVYYCPISKTQKV